jgi:hypothetical protein
MAASKELIDGKLIRELFLLQAIDDENARLERLLRSTIKECKEYWGSLLVEFLNGNILLISNSDGNYNICFGYNNSLYCNGEDGTSKISSDRLAFYLERCATYVEA